MSTSMETYYDGVSAEINRKKGRERMGEGSTGYPVAFDERMGETANIVLILDHPGAGLLDSWSGVIEVYRRP